MRSIRFASSVLVLAMTLAPAAARAEDTAATGAATQLFDEGVTAMNQGNLAEACSKFQRSQELAPNGGTLMALGDCYEKNGQPASAWVAFKAAVDRAISARKPDAEKAAREAAARVEPKISRLTVDVPKRSEIDGLVVKRDGKPVVAAEWNIAVPLDPGLHTFEASAPGRKPWSTRVAIGANASQKSVTVPLLEIVPGEQSGDITPITPMPQPEAQGSSGKGQRIAGLVVGGLGIVGLGLGTVFGLQAKSKNDDAANHCVTTNVCDATGISLDKDARSAATISTVAFIAGGVLTVGGVVLFVTAPSKKEPAAQVGIRGTPGGAAMTFGGTF